MHFSMMVLASIATVMEPISLIGEPNSVASPCTLLSQIEKTVQWQRD